MPGCAANGIQGKVCPGIPNKLTLSIVNFLPRERVGIRRKSGGSLRQGRASPSWGNYGGRQNGGSSGGGAGPAITAPEARKVEDSTLGRLLENHSKQLLAENQIPLPRFLVAGNASEAIESARQLGCEVVVKALVPVGKRGKAGAIKFAADPESCAAATWELLGMVVRHYPVEQVLVEEKLAIDQELFVSITLDKSARKIAILASSAGGIDVEEISVKYPEQMKILRVDPFRGLADFQAKQLWAELGLGGAVLRQATDILIKLYKMFVKYDCTILEINPLAITKEAKVIAAAALMAVDDSAMYRHPELSAYVQIGSDRAWRPLTALEKQVVEVNEADPYRGTARYTEIDGGDIGFMCGGEGAV